MGHRYKIFTDRNLLVDVMEGPVRLIDLERIYKHEIGDENFKHVRKILSNIVDADFQLSMEEVNRFIEMMMQPDPDPSFRWAILTNTPRETALSMILKSEAYFNNVIGVFYTLNECNRFLDISFKSDEFDGDNYVYLD